MFTTFDPQKRKANSAKKARETEKKIKEASKKTKEKIKAAKKKTVKKAKVIVTGKWIIIFVVCISFSGCAAVGLDFICGPGSSCQKESIPRLEKVEKPDLNPIYYKNYMINDRDFYCISEKGMNDVVYNETALKETVKFCIFQTDEYLKFYKDYNSNNEVQR